MIEHLAYTRERADGTVDALLHLAEGHTYGCSYQPWVPGAALTVARALWFCATEYHEHEEVAVTVNDFTYPAPVRR